jgi:outer membrane protein OmpA-like peptidoglycan-associated protein
MRSPHATLSIVGVTVLSTLAVRAQPSPGGHVTTVTLAVTLEKFDGPCGSKFALAGNMNVSAPGKVWYRFVAPSGVKLIGPPEEILTVGSAGPLGVGTDAIFAQATKGEFRLEAAIQRPDGKHGPVTQSSSVPFDFKCSGSASGGTTAPPPQPSPASPAAASNGLPSELPLPPRVALAPNVQHIEYGQDDFPHPAPNVDHITVAGHLWRAFLKGDAQSLGVAAWKATLENAGWEVLSDRQGAIVARHGDWWAKIGLDRLTLVQRIEADAFILIPPGERVEELRPNEDVPYLAPLPGTARKIWKTEPHFDLKRANEPELLMLGPALYLRYEGPPQLSALEVQARYSAALRKAGWDVRSADGSATGAHFTQHGRDVWVKITAAGAAYVVETADLGAAAEQNKLAKALDDSGHVALYGIYFDTDKDTLRHDSDATLVQIQNLLISHPAMRLEIQGHTDNTGNRPHNQKLSEDRAASVKAWLVAKGINESRLNTKGYADTKSVADNSTPQGRALNRRVELARL